MKIHHYHDVQELHDAPGVVRRVVIGAEHGAPRFVMRVFELAPGSSTPFHSHWWEHEVFVLSGEGLFKCNGSETPVRAGMAVFVAPEEQHCFSNTGGDTLRFICVIPLAAAAPPPAR
ncbi:MAG: cupin domain-containing protein [Chloroflexota bacterium]